MQPMLLLISCNHYLLNVSYAWGLINWWLRLDEGCCCCVAGGGWRFPDGGLVLTRGACWSHHLSDRWRVLLLLLYLSRMSCHDSMCLLAAICVSVCWCLPYFSLQFNGEFFKLLQHVLPSVCWLQYTCLSASSCAYGEPSCQFCPCMWRRVWAKFCKRQPDAAQEGGNLCDVKGNWVSLIFQNTMKMFPFVILHYSFILR